MWYDDSKNCQMSNAIIDKRFLLIDSFVASKKAKITENFKKKENIYLKKISKKMNTLLNENLLHKF